MTTYLWKAGARCNVNAQVAGEVLERLRERTGKLVPAEVVYESRPEDAPLHPEFEWNDGVAAEKYREDQARYVIRSIAVVREDKPDEEPVRAFVSVVLEDDDGDSERSFTSLDVAMTDEKLRRQLLASAVRDLAAAKKKYGDLVELSAVFAEVDIALTQYRQAAE